MVIKWWVKGKSSVILFGSICIEQPEGIFKLFFKTCIKSALIIIQYLKESFNLHLHTCFINPVRKLLAIDYNSPLQSMNLIFCFKQIHICHRFAK